MTVPPQYHASRCSRRLLLAVAAICAGMLAVRDAAAQPATGPSPEANTANDAQGVATLKSRLAALRRQAEQERAAAAKSAASNEEELKTLTAQRAELADKLLTLEIERERNAEKLKMLQAESRTLAADAKQAAASAASLATAIRDAAEQLRLHLRETPGNDDATDRLAAIASALAIADTVEQREAQLPAILEFLSIVDNSHAAATGVRVTTASIFTAAGDREEVKLLSIGHARFAYETVAGNRVGLALSSAEDAAGYRWTENPPSDAQAGIRDAIAACQTSPGELISIPFDPTGRLRLEEVNKTQSVYEWFVAGGMVTIPLVAVAIVAIGLVIERAICLYAANPSANGVAQEVLAACRAGDFDRAARECAEHRGAAPRVFAACLAKRPLGQRAMEDAIQEQLLHELPPLHRFMGALATLAGIAPLLGLLGTVTGIIQTFDVIRSFGNANPALMAGGISEALITTALGLMIAVPVVILHSLLRARSDRILADAERHSAALLTTLVHRPASDENADRPRNASRSVVMAEAVTAPSRTNGAHGKPAKEPAIAKEATVD
jgi:biopolymer transport protein ExbB